MQCQPNQIDRSLCPACHKKLNLSIFTLPCGHSYHKGCLESVIKKINVSSSNPLPSSLSSSLTLTPLPTALKDEELSQSTPLFLFNQTLKPLPDPLPWNQLPDLSQVKSLKKPSTVSKSLSKLPFALVCKINDLTRQEYELCCAVCEVPMTLIKNTKNAGDEISKILYYLEQENRLERFLEFLKILDQKECLEAIHQSSASFLFGISPRSFLNC